MRVAVFIGTRADLGPLASVIEALAEATDIDLVLMTGVAFNAGSLRDALGLVAPKALFSAEIVEAAPAITSLEGQTVSESGPRLSSGVNEALHSTGVDALVVLGDRWELLYVVPAAFLNRVPVIHIHGGEVTTGALDDRVRHAVTKLADHHCVASPDAAHRVLQMGEPQDRVHLTGAPGLDRVVEAQPMALEELEDLLGGAVRRPLALFTYHPPTAEVPRTVGEDVRQALAATLDQVAHVIVTYPGMDEGREQIIDAVEDMSREDSRITLVPSLGRDYARVLHSVDVVVGNSSSGIIEAPSARKPSVDVGERQRGRLRSDSVFHCDEGFDHVKHAVREALDVSTNTRYLQSPNPYGDGRSAARIVKVVRAAVSAQGAKPFVDIGGPNDD